MFSVFMCSIVFHVIFTDCLIELDFSDAVLRYKTDRNFLSFTVDSHQLKKHWAAVNLRNESLINMTKQLVPAYMRIGGTDADDITFQPTTPIDYKQQQKDSLLQNESSDTLCNENDSNNSSNTVQSRKHIFYGEDILILKEFIERTGAELIYDLNALQRNDAWEWDPNNSRELLKFMSQNNMKVKGWELGNEPDHFKHVFNVTISPHQHAQDFSVLKNLLSEFRDYKNSLVIGPDTTRPIPSDSKIPSVNYLKQFLRNIKPGILSKITIHQYFFAGKTASVQDFMNVTIMNNLRHEIRLARRIATKFYPNVPLWIGETSSGWGGGCRHVSNKFAESFMWLDKLGQSAKEGIQVVFRQTLKGGWYGLVSPQGQPAPDYFVSVLYKRLVGQVVIGNLNVTKRNAINIDNLKRRLPKSLRLYTHCSTESNGAVTIFGINVGEKSYKIFIKGQTLIEEYLIAAPENNALSRHVNLNGDKMKLDKYSQFPRVFPVKRHHHFIFPATSLGFWVLPHANLTICN